MSAHTLHPPLVRIGASAGVAPLVLIADDEPHARITLEFLIGRAGRPRMLSAASGIEALDLALELRPQLCVLDVVMPDLDGYTICRTLRREAADAAGMTIWLISGRRSAVDADQARTVGADRFIGKPFDPDLLVADVEHLLRRCRAGLHGHATLQCPPHRV